jgi:hypothetical protein
MDFCIARGGKKVPGSRTGAIGCVLIPPNTGDLNRWMQLGSGGMKQNLKELGLVDLHFPLSEIS